MARYRQYTIKVNLTADLLSALMVKYGAHGDEAVLATLEGLLMAKLAGLREELDIKARKDAIALITKA